MEKVKKTAKIVGRVLLILLGALIAGLLIMFIVHRVMLSGEEKMLREKGYLNRVSVGDYSLNVCYYGSDDPKHTIVGFSGKGVHDFSVAMRPITDRFADENRIVFVDRAGYGLSDDSKLPQTSEQIVEDYRAALKNAGFEAPYILMPHSLAGIYVTWWLSTYPEEIEGVVFLDSTPAMDDQNTFDFSSDGWLMENLELAGCKIGLQRLFYEKFDEMAFATVPEGMEDLSHAIVMNHAFSHAMISEDELANQNCYEAYKIMKETDIPKLYIKDITRTEDDFREMIELMNSTQRKIGGKEFTLPEDVSKAVSMSVEFIEETYYPYVRSLGNTELREINGTHMFYYYKPEETADMIEEYLEKLDK